MISLGPFRPLTDYHGPVANREGKSHESKQDSEDKICEGARLEGQQYGKKGGREG